ncbi:HemK Methylase of polypeptide chain release factors [Acidimicrobiia bacterium]
MSNADGTITWRQLHAEAVRRLTHDSLGDPAECEMDARRIIERASGFEGADYVLGLDEAATERGVHYFDVMLGRRLTGEPLQYVVGRWGFRTLDLLVDKRVLIPRPETESVAGWAISELEFLRPHAVTNERRLLAVDLGTGSGAIGLAIATECARVDVWLTDESPEALAVAQANLTGIGGAGTSVRIGVGSWFEALPAELAGTVDVIVSNPPYVADDDELPSVVRDWEPGSALFAGVDGLDDLRVIVAEASAWLHPRGSLVLEMAPMQVDAVADLARSAGFVDVEIRSDLTGRNRGVVARRVHRNGD